MSCYIEMANGNHSRVYDTVESAKAAVADYRSHRARMDPHFSEPVRIVCSDGTTIEISSGGVKLTNNFGPCESISSVIFCPGENITR
jgi:hypothetical protein